MTAENVIGIIGPGRMGIGIATAILASGKPYSIKLFDTKPREKDQALESIRHVGTPPKRLWRFMYCARASSRCIDVQSGQKISEKYNSA